MKVKGISIGIALLIAFAKVTSEKAHKDGYCFANIIDKKYGCCNTTNVIEYSDGDGDWGLEGGNWCGFRNSTPRWNDREKIKETKKEWKYFKIQWDNVEKDNYERLSILPGEDETMLNFGWYSKTDNSAIIRFGTDKSMQDSKEFAGTVKYHRDINDVSYYVNRVTVTGLKPNSSYYYQRKLNGQWEDTIKFETGDSKNFSIAYFGDPQIGGSKGRISVINATQTLNTYEATRNDAFNWNDTIYKTYYFKDIPNPDFFFTAGDNANEQNDYDIQEEQYSAFLLPKLMQQVRLVPAMGNHEVYSYNFKNHFNVPNPYYDEERKKVEGIPSYNYYFKHNNLLVIVLESTTGTEKEFKQTFALADEACKECDWRVVMFHHDIYGSGAMHYGEERKQYLLPILSELVTKYNIDVVINGHDHVYSQSHFIRYENDERITTILNKDTVYQNPKGTLFISANCSTGSKLHDIKHKDFDFIKTSKQTFTTSFGSLIFENNNGKLKLKIINYDLDNNKIIDGPFYIEKDSKYFKTTTTTKSTTTTTTTTTTTAKKTTTSTTTKKTTTSTTTKKTTTTTKKTTTTTKKTTSTTTKKTSTTSKIPTSTSSNGKCGPDYGACPKSGHCCSKYGYCGTSSDYCGSGCQKNFGKCD